MRWWLSGKESIWKAGDTGDSGLIPGSGRSPEEGNGNWLQYSHLKNPMNRGAWRATVHGVAKSRTWQRLISLLQDFESESEVAQSCLTCCDPKDCSLPGFSIHGIFQARTLEWVAISFSRGSSWPRDWTQVSCTAGRWFPFWATSEAQMWLM